VIPRLFSILKLSLSTCLKYKNISRKLFDMCNKLFSLNFDMGNPYPSLFLGNIECKLVKLYKIVISRLFSILQLSLSTFLEFIEILPGMCLTCAIQCFPSILIWAIQMFNGRSLSNNIKTVIFKFLYYNCHYQHVGILEILP